MVAAGKSNWLTPRPDPVQAKGKGLIHTWWLDLGKSKTSGTACSWDGTIADSSTVPTLKPLFASCCASKEDRLVNWITDILREHICQLVAVRQRQRSKSKSFHATFNKANNDATPLDEVAEVIYLPRFNEQSFSEAKNANTVQVSDEVLEQLRLYVATIASHYRDNPVRTAMFDLLLLCGFWNVFNSHILDCFELLKKFHNFEHACHVTMATNKFLKRIVSPDIAFEQAKIGDIASRIHDYTHGINSDPLTLLAILFSALIHDVSAVSDCIQKKHAIITSLSSHSSACFALENQKGRSPWCIQYAAHQRRTAHGRQIPWQECR